MSELIALLHKILFECCDNDQCRYNTTVLARLLRLWLD